LQGLLQANFIILGLFLGSFNSGCDMTVNDPGSFIDYIIGNVDMR